MRRHIFAKSVYQPDVVEMKKKQPENNCLSKTLHVLKTPRVLVNGEHACLRKRVPTA